jgi:hypothetical protein
MEKEDVLIDFSGKEKNRGQNLLESKDGIDIKLARQGSPIGAFSTKTRFDNQKPNGIIFKNHGNNNPLFIGNVEPGDKFYVWFSKSIDENYRSTQQIKIKTKAWIENV